MFFDGLADAEAQLVRMLCDITGEESAAVLRVWTSEKAMFVVDGLARLTAEDSKGGRSKP